jgi:hypothetical protein
VTDRMGALEWIVRWWRQAVPPPGERPHEDTMQEPTPSVPAEWLSLHTYLQHRYASTVVLTFGQMEMLLGRALPEAARTDRAWWTDAASRGSRCSDAWTAARRTATPNLPAQTVAFERRG